MIRSHKTVSTVSRAPLQFPDCITTSRALLQSPDCITTSHAPLQFPDCITCSPPVPRLYHDITCSPPVPRLYHDITCSPPVSRLYHMLPSSFQTVSRAPLQFPDCMLYLRLDKLPSDSIMQSRLHIFKEGDRYFRGRDPRDHFASIESEGRRKFRSLNKKTKKIRVSEI